MAWHRPLALSGLSAALTFSAMLVIPASAAVVANVRTNVTGTESIGGTVTDFIVFNPGGSTITRSGGPGMFTIPTVDGSLINAISPASPPVTMAWSNGTPTTSGSTTSYLYAGFGSNYTTSQSSYLEMTFNMPATSGTASFWLRPNGNSGNINFTVTMGKAGNQFTNTYTNVTSMNGMVMSFDMTGFSVNDSVTFRIDNVSGSNAWHNIGIYGAQFAPIPEPAAAAMLATGAMAAVMRRRRNG